MNTKQNIARVVLLIPVILCMLIYGYFSSANMVLKQEIEGLRIQATLDQNYENLVSIFLKKYEDGKIDREDIQKIRDSYRKLIRSKNSLKSDPRNRRANQALEPTSTGVTPPAIAGDRASGTRGSP